MKATLSVVRTYGSTTRWGRLPREIPAGSPIVLGNYPKGWTTSIHFGVPPAWVLKGERLRRVYARTVLRGQFLPTQGNYDRQAIEAMIADESIGPIVEQWDHWLTIACEQVVNVPDSEWSTYPFAWIEPTPVIFDSAERARTSVAAAMDAILSLVSFHAPAAISGSPVLNDVYYRDVDGDRPPFAFPAIRSIQGRVIIGEPHLDLTLVSHEAEALRHLEAGSAVDLRTPLYWWVRAVEEGDDRTRFLFAFTALEVVVNKMSKIARTKVAATLTSEAEAVGKSLPDAMIHDESRSSLLTKFAFLAYLLEPTKAQNDTFTFKRLKDFRDDMAHGDARLDTAFPVSALEELGRRYLTLTTKYLTAEAVSGNESGERTSGT